MKEATARGNDLPVAWKSAIMVGRFIKGKSLSKAKRLMEEVISEKTAVQHGSRKISGKSCHGSA